jgi:hypothetical protein
MIDWRTLLKAPANTQNEQFMVTGGDSADIAHIADRETVKDRALTPSVCSSHTFEGLLPPGHSASSVNAGPTPPLQLGWLVTYRDGRGILCGGPDDRQRGTVAGMHYGTSGWTVTVADGTRFPLSVVRSVTKADAHGKVVAAWTVREHGADGMRA